MGRSYRAPLLLALTVVALSGSMACTSSSSMGSATPSASYFEPPVHDLPRSDDARLSIQWIGHATMLVQMDDKWILTDPFLEHRMALVQGRMVGAGLAPQELPKLDAVLISHMHPDHLSLGSLGQIQRKVSRLFVPEGGLVYIPDYSFDVRQLRTWQSFESDGLRITAVPVRHVGGRYGIDTAWMTKSFTGYVVEYHGLSVFFGGDTAYDAHDFQRTRQSFPHLDVALLPIAPIRPYDRMRKVHMDPDGALDALTDLGASKMVPMHFDTLKSDDGPGEARARLLAQAHARGLDDRVEVLRVGQRAVIVPK
jgi:L-ascorbate metabolism protein UlaG (beta-lactamase superfamily)